MPKEIHKRFYQDPEWQQVEDIILAHIMPLIDMSTVDTKQPAEHVKAEIIARNIAYDSLFNFLSQAKIVNQPMPPKVKKNPFR